MHARRIVVEVLSSFELSEDEILKELLEAEIRMNEAGKLRFHLLPESKMDKDQMKSLLTTAIHTTEKDAVFTIIGLTPYEEGKLQEWLYISNGKRSEMVGGLENILENWKRKN
jgi:phosphotransferase system IIB component